MEEKGFFIKDESLAMTGKIEFHKPKSYSIIAMNLETVEDMEKVIRQCEFIKEQMADGSHKLSINKNGNLKMD